MANLKLTGGEELGRRASGRCGNRQGGVLGGVGGGREIRRGGVRGWVDSGLGALFLPPKGGASRRGGDGRGEGHREEELSVGATTGVGKVWDGVDGEDGVA